MEVVMDENSWQRDSDMIFTQITSGDFPTRTRNHNLFFGSYVLSVHEYLVCWLPKFTLSIVQRGHWSVSWLCFGVSRHP
jgi:hypothetical protein